MDDVRATHLSCGENTNSFSSSKSITNEHFENDKKQGSKSHHEITGCNIQLSIAHKEQETCSRKLKINRPGKSSDKCKKSLSDIVMVTPTSVLFRFGKNCNKRDSENVNYKEFKTLNLKCRKPVLKCFIREQNTDSSDKEKSCRKIECTKPTAQFCTYSLLMKKQMLEKRDGIELRKFNHNQRDSCSNSITLKNRYHVQSDLEYECNTNLNYNHCLDTGKPKQGNESGIFKTNFQSPKFFDRNRRIQYQLAHKLMPVSTSKDLVLQRKINIKKHSIETITECNKNNIGSTYQSQKTNSSDKTQPAHCNENPLCKTPAKGLPIRKMYESKTVFCKSPEMYFSSVSTLDSNENHSSHGHSTSTSNSSSENIQQLLHPHWRRVPHKSYFGWTNTHETVFNELQKKVSYIIL